MLDEWLFGEKECMLSGRNKDGAEYAIQMGILYTWRKARRG